MNEYDFLNIMKKAALDAVDAKKPVRIEVGTVLAESPLKVLKYLDKLSQNGIEINAQLVLCPNINDGKVLDKTISKKIVISNQIKKQE